MVIIKKEFIHTIPVLHAVNQEKQGEALPMVIFVHGFTSAKENNLHIAYLLAEKGFRVVLPDAQYHGDRDEGLKEEDLAARFWDIVINTIREVNIVKDHYVQKGLAAPGKIGLAGTSMGGIVTLGSMTQYGWVDAAVSLMGAPSYTEMARWQADELKKVGYKLPYSEEEIESQISSLAGYDLSLQPEKLDGRPLLFWHGEADNVVPHRFAFGFYQQLVSAGTPEHTLRFVSERNAGHKVTRKGTYALVDWFTDHLCSKDDKSIWRGETAAN